MAYEFSFKEPTNYEKTLYVLDMLTQLADMARQCGESAIAETLEKIVSERAPAEEQPAEEQYDAGVRARSLHGRA